MLFQVFNRDPHAILVRTLFSIIFGRVSVTTVRLSQLCLVT